MEKQLNNPHLNRLYQDLLILQTKYPTLPKIPATIKAVIAFNSFDPGITFQQNSQLIKFARQLLPIVQKVPSPESVADLNTMLKIISGYCKSQLRPNWIPKSVYPTHQTLFHHLWRKLCHLAAIPNHVTKNFKIN
jgi:hypothetical protein